MPLAVIFDLDGTLWDSRPWYGTVVAATERDGVAEHDSLAVAAFEVECATRQPMSLFPHVLEALTVLVDRGVPLGVATSLPGWMCFPMLRRACLDRLLPLHAVAHLHTTAHCKPSSDPLLHVLGVLGVTPGAGVWFVGDSLIDAEAADAARLSFGFASWGYGTVPDALITRLLTTPADLVDLP